jgi:transcriptional regulator with XRE-family HTH domain
MLGDRIKTARAWHGWTQSQLAEYASVPQPVISRLESGERDSVTTDVAKRLARALGVSVDHLIGTWEDLEEKAAAPR